MRIKVFEYRFSEVDFSINFTKPKTWQYEENYYYLSSV